MISHEGRGRCRDGTQESRERTPVPFEQRWRRRFVERGALMDDDADIAGWTRTGLATRVRQFSRLWQDSPGALGGEWLDVGCGAGTYTRLLHDQGYTVLGLDYSAPSLQKARARSPAEIGWAAADIHHLPLRAERVQGVLCFGVVQALDDSAHAMGELARVIRPGGEVWIDALNARCLPTRLSEWRRRRRGGSPHLRYESSKRFCHIAREAGLEVVALEWLLILPGRLQRFQRLLEIRLMRWLLRRLPWLGELFSHSFILRARRPLGTKILQ